MAACLTMERRSRASIIISLGIAAGATADGPALEVERWDLMHLGRGGIGDITDPLGVSFARCEQDAGKRRCSSRKTAAGTT
eukprot:2721240-Pyramimonas_sp.AAC.1